MKVANLDRRLAKAASDVEDARQESPGWVTEKLIALTQAESSESVRNCYQQILALKNQPARINMQPSFESLTDSEKKSALLDFKDILAAWRNIKSLENRQKIQVNIQISKEAKSILEALAKKHRFSQGQVIESILLRKAKTKGAKRTIERTASLPDLTSTTPDK